MGWPLWSLWGGHLPSGEGRTFWSLPLRDVPYCSDLTWRILATACKCSSVEAEFRFMMSNTCTKYRRSSWSVRRPSAPSVKWRKRRCDRFQVPARETSVTWRRFYRDERMAGTDLVSHRCTRLSSPPGPGSVDIGIVGVSRRGEPESGGVSPPPISGAQGFWDFGGLHRQPQCRRNGKDPRGHLPRPTVFLAGQESGGGHSRLWAAGAWRSGTEAGNHIFSGGCRR